MNKVTNSVLIGYDTGSSLSDANSVVIIGDGIKDLAINQQDVIFINDKVAIGKTVLGIKCNLYDILKDNMSIKTKNCTRGTYVGTESEMGSQDGTDSMVITGEATMTHIEVEALKLCCKTYESASLKQQALMTEKDKEIRRQALRIEKLEKIIVNNIKNGKQFIDVPRGTC